MPLERKATPTRLDVATLFRAPSGVDEELLAIFLKYNDVLMAKGISSFNIWMKRAHYLYGLKRYDEAIDAIQSALTYEPTSSDAHFLLGVCLQLQALAAGGGRIEEPLGEESRRLLEGAALAFRAAMDLNPADGESEQLLLNLRCILYAPETTAASAVSAAVDDPDAALAAA